MKLFVIPFFMVASAFSCFNTSSINTQDNSASPVGPGTSLVCSEIISHLEVGLATGGQSFKVGDTLVFGANPVSATGDNVPTECRNQAVTAQALGTCTPVAGAVQSHDAIAFVATGVGTCSAHVFMGKAEGVSDPVQIK